MFTIFFKNDIIYNNIRVLGDVKMMIDLHVHSKYSFDANDSVRDIAKSAIEKKINYLAITDHKDYFWKIQATQLDIKGVFDDIDSVRSEFSGEIKLLKGIELGEINARPEALQLTKEYPFDMVIGSLHSMPDDVDFYDVDYEKIDSDKLLKDYLSELKKMVDYGGFDVLAHIDYPLRKMEKANIKPSFENYMELVVPVLKSVIDKEIALEINAAGLFSYLKSVGPQGFVLDEYKRLGGSLISIGSDSHKACDVGRGINQCINHALKHGFKYVTVFENRKPCQVFIGENN